MPATAATPARKLMEACEVVAGIKLLHRTGSGCDTGSCKADLGSGCGSLSANPLAGSILSADRADAADAHHRDVLGTPAHKAAQLGHTQLLSCGAVEPTSQCSTASLAPQQAASSSSCCSTKSSPGSTNCDCPAVEYLLLELAAAARRQAPGSAPQPCPDQAGMAAAACSPPGGLLSASGSCSVASPEQHQAAQAGAVQGAGTQAQEGGLCAGAAGDAGGDNPIVLGTSLFFARVPPTVPCETIMELFEQYGTVLTLNLFRPWATAKTSKGCGIVVYKDITAAMAAMDALHNKYHWTGGETVMVVEWADPSRHRRENPETKGVFEAKHKTPAVAGSKSRYRAQVRRAVALSLQQACAAGGAPQHMLKALPGMLAPVATASRVLQGPDAPRGVGNMLPQMAGPGLAPAPAVSWGMVGMQARAPGIAAPSDYLGTLAAAAAAAASAAAPYANGSMAASAAAPYANGSMAASAAVLNRSMSCGTADGGMLMPGAGLQCYTPAGLHCNPQAMAAQLGHSSAPVYGGWGMHGDAAASFSPLASLGGASSCNTEPGSPAIAAGGLPALQQPGLASVFNPAMLHHAGLAPSRLGPAGGRCPTPAAAVGQDCCCSATSMCMQHFIQQEPPISYLCANAGLVADANMLAAATAAAFGSHAQHGQYGGLQVNDCGTPLSGKQSLFVPDVCDSTCLGPAPAAVLGAPALPQQQHWLALHRQHFAGSTGSLPSLSMGPCTPGVGAGGMGFCSTGSNCSVSGLGGAFGGGSISCGTPTYL